MGIIGRVCVLGFLLCVALVARPLSAQGLPDASIPPELRPWVPWVLESMPERDCRRIDGDAVCVWPGSLRVDIAPNGGRFELAVFLDQEEYVPLPGSAGQWPEAVKLGGRPATIVSVGDKPVVRASKGAHVVSGSFVWKKAPESLSVPPRIGKITLVSNGVEIPQPKRSSSEALWLASSGESSSEAEALSIDVARAVADGIPLRVTTRITLRVSGRAREVDLGKVLVPGTTAEKLESALPVRLDSDGSLHAKLRSGTYVVEIVARSERQLDVLEPPVLADPWPSEETWVWNARPQLRDVELSGAPSIDPGRTRLEGNWRILPAYLLDRGKKLRFVTTRRGEPEPPPNRIELDRAIFLDFDGDGYTIEDTFGGNLERGFRLDRTSGELGRAVAGGVDQLITLGKGGLRGVELRERKLSLVAESRESAARELSAVGWSEGVERLRATLHLPPGYRLFATRGVDTVSGSWVSSFDLFELLFIAVVVAAFARLFGLGWGAVLLGLLVLSHGESGAPYAIWVFLIAFTALLRVTKPGRFERVVRAAWNVSAFVFALVAVTFVVEQVRAAVYPSTAGTPSDFELGWFTKSLGAPEVISMSSLDQSKVRIQLERGIRDGKSANRRGEAKEEAPAKYRAKSGEEIAQAPAADAPVDAPLAMVPRSPGDTVGAGVGSERDEGRNVDLTKQDPNAVIQTGPGMPSWSSPELSLEWSGPVSRDQRVRLYLVTPAMAAMLAAARVLLLALLALLVLRSTPLGRAARKIAPAVALLLGVFNVASPARAEAPSTELLDELGKRLVPDVPCGSQCVSVSSSNVRAEGRRLAIESEVHVGAIAALRLPGPAATWVFDTVTVDGAPSSAIVLASNGFLFLRLDPGIHRVRIEGRLTEDELDLSLGDTPRRVTLDAKGWDVQGVLEDGSTEGSLHFSRLAEVESDGEKSSEGTALTPWFEIERWFDIGPVWTIRTTLRRVSPAGSPAVLRYPLLEGETPASTAFAVEKGHVVVSLGRDATSASWQSTLRPRDALHLLAPARSPWTEVWVLDCGVVWRCTPSGLPPLQRVDGEGRHQPVFRPWPGEALDLKFDRPSAAKGASLTIDDVHYEATPGPRLVNATLRVELRTSTGGTQTIELPPGSVLKKLLVSGEQRAARLDGRKLAVSLRPGPQVLDVEFHRPGGLGTRFELPVVDVGRPFVNGAFSVVLPRERWLLFAGGPASGSVILFWGYIGVIAVVAFMLPRLRNNPLRGWEWLVLGLGLTQVSVLAALAVLGWLFLTRFRAKYEPGSAFRYNALQLLFVLLTLAAAAIAITAAYRGLVFHPDMMVMGGAESLLNWYVDRSGSATPGAWVVSAPLFVFRALMIAWSLWAAWSFTRFLRAAYAAFTTGPIAMPFRLRREPARQPARSSEPADRTTDIESPDQGSPNQ